MDKTDIPLVEFIEKCFWGLLTVFGTIFLAAGTAIVGVLWSMNGNLSSLNAQLGTMVERIEKQEQASDAQAAILSAHGVELQEHDFLLRRKR